MELRRCVSLVPHGRRALIVPPILLATLSMLGPFSIDTRSRPSSRCSRTSQWGLLKRSSLILQLGPWQWVFAFMALLGTGLVVATVLILPESHPVERRTPLAPRAVLAGVAEVARMATFHRLAWPPS